MAWGVRPHPRINSVEALWFSSGVSFGSSPATPPTAREPGMRSPSRLLAAEAATVQSVVQCRQTRIQGKQNVKACWPTEAATRQFPV
jgi:hypothetical protein